MTVPSSRSSVRFAPHIPMRRVCAPPAAVGAGLARMHRAPMAPNNPIGPQYQEHSESNRALRGTNEATEKRQRQQESKAHTLCTFGADSQQGASPYLGSAGSQRRKLHAVWGSVSMLTGGRSPILAPSLGATTNRNWRRSSRAPRQEGAAIRLVLQGRTGAPFSPSSVTAHRSR